MKKTFFLLITLLGTIAFTSCGDDDEVTLNTNTNQTTTTSFVPSSLSGKKIVFSTDTWEHFYFNTTSFTYKDDSESETLDGTPTYSFTKTGATTADLTMIYSLKDFIGTSNYSKSYKFIFTSAHGGSFTGYTTVATAESPSDTTGWANEGTFSLY
ncbi:MAG: hypothetical protein H6Q15_172 [Bacteroidetes bacterium]|nr:hypothetical protein [Bacteroidota bacterium]